MNIFILPIYYFSLIISYVSENNIRDRTGPSISFFKCIFKKTDDTHTMNAHATKKHYHGKTAQARKQTGPGAHTQSLLHL